MIGIQQNPNKQSGNSPPEYSELIAHRSERDFIPPHSDGSPLAIGLITTPTPAPPKSCDLYANVPQELKDQPNWVVWRYERRGNKPTKVPYNPKTHKKADSSDPSTWVEYDVALRARSNFDGVGYVISAPYAVIDLDDVRNPDTGEIEEWAMKIVREVESFTEVSPSGRGLHLWVRGNLPQGNRRSGRVEMYDERRYFTVTGQHLADTRLTVEDRNLASLHSRIKILDPNNIKSPQSAPSSVPFDSKFERLMAGQWRQWYSSQSEADLALCALLARKHGCNAEKIDSEFRTSGLYRHKWDREDYRNSTVEQAISSVTARADLKATEPLTTGICNWRSGFKSYGELAKGENEFLIKGFLPAGVTFIGGLPGSGKTWLALSLAKALVTGQKFLGHYEVPKLVSVVYLTPEVGDRAFRSRLETMKLTNVGDSFLCRTLNDEPLDLNDQYLIEAVKAKNPVIVLDTTIRFSKADSENSATDSRQLTQGVLGLLREGAAGVVCLHHALKSSAQESKLTLETTLRGSGDLGAICDSAWGLKCVDADKLDIDVRCVKARDFEMPPSFRIMGRPYLNDKGDFVLVDEHCSENSKAKLFREFVVKNPKGTYRDVQEKVGVSIGKVQKYAKSLGWKKVNGLWEHTEDT